MAPKKKSYFDYIVYVICLGLALFIAAHAAVAAAESAAMVAAGTLEESEMLVTGAQMLTERLTAAPLSLSITEYTKKFMFYGFFIWMIAVLAIENRKRNYIRGKEFGTSKWGTLSDIKDLFAENICREEIKKAKQVRTALGRARLKRKLYKECEKNGKTLEKAKLDELADEEHSRKAAGTYDKKLHAEAVKKIKEEAAESVALAKREAWQPDQLKYDLELRLEEINNSPFYNGKEEKAKQEALARDEYEEKMKQFIDSRKKIESIRRKYKDADMHFTKTERISIYNYKLNNNTLILGGSGSGKTRGYVMPNVMQAHSSYIITDPKGEILEKAGYFLKEVKGYKIRVLNLDEKANSDCYNPFVYIHPERDGYEERVLSLIETIIVNTDGGERKGGSDPFWDKAERLFLQAVFFFTCDGFIEEERNMNTVLELIGMLKIEEEQDDFSSDLDYFAKIFERDHGSTHIGVQQYNEFRQKASGKTAKSIVISTVARLAPFRASEVRRIFTDDSMLLDRVGEEKTAVFVVVPPTDDTFNFIAGMLFTQLFQELQYCATQVHKHDGQRLPVPCRFILDEFANTCTIPNFVKILAYARSFGIGITPIIQSLEQLKNMYKDEWGVIVDNCNTLLYLGSITHMDTLEYISKLIGKGTFDKKTTGHSRGRSGSSSENFDVVGRELMDASELRRLEKKNCILIVGGRNPFYSEKYPYESHPNYRYTSDGNHAYSFSYTPVPPVRKPKPEVQEEIKPGENARIDTEEVGFSADAGELLAEALKHIDVDDLRPWLEAMYEDGEVDDDVKSELEGLFRELEEEEAPISPSKETREYLDSLVPEIRINTDPEEVLAEAELLREDLRPLDEVLTDGEDAHNHGDYGEDGIRFEADPGKVLAEAELVREDLRPVAEDEDGEIVIMDEESMDMEGFGDDEEIPF